jgi:hypothetical protein
VGGKEESRSCTRMQGIRIYGARKRAAPALLRKHIVRRCEPRYSALVRHIIRGVVRDVGEPSKLFKSEGLFDCPATYHMRGELVPHIAVQFDCNLVCQNKGFFFPTINTLY